MAQALMLKLPLSNRDVETNLSRPRQWLIARGRDKSVLTYIHLYYHVLRTSEAMCASLEWMRQT